MTTKEMLRLAGEIVATAGAIGVVSGCAPVVPEVAFAPEFTDGTPFWADAGRRWTSRDAFEIRIPGYDAMTPFSQSFACREQCLPRRYAAAFQVDIPWIGMRRVFREGFVERCDALGADEVSCRVRFERVEQEPAGPSRLVIGRRPRGGGAAVAYPATAEWLGQGATLEAASVIAFEQLAVSLRRFKAPEELVATSLRSAHDERRHAMLMTALARRHGSEPAAPEIAEVPEPTIEALVIDNAIEGCVRETLGAIEAAWMAEHSPDPEIRFVMRSIARDEARHAALAWRIDAWVRGRVDTAPLDAAMRHEIGVLTKRAPYSAELVALGLPDAARASAMVQGLGERLWRMAA